MKTDGSITRLLSIHCRNERDYYDRVITPLLDYLDIPKGEERWPEFPIETFLGLQKTDYLICVDDIPMMAVEAKVQAALFDNARKQVEFFATNFDPKLKGIRKQTVPYIIAAGNRAQVFKVEIAPNGLDQMFRPIVGFLEWGELVAQADHFRKTTAGQLGLFPSIAEEAQVSESLRISELTRQFLYEIYSAIRGSRSLPDDDQKIRCLNDVVGMALSGGNLKAIAVEYSLSSKAMTYIGEALSWHKNILEQGRFSGPAVAYAYRDFISDRFTGKSFGFFKPTGKGQQGKGKNIGRYLTPKEVLSFMVQLANVRAEDKVMDFACGSGGFLAEIVGKVRSKSPENLETFVRCNLLACDIDPFSVSSARTFLNFIYPELKDHFKIFQHNGLYSENAPKSDLPEDRDFRKFVRKGAFDLVISNPPGNSRYSGTNDEYVRRKYGQATYFEDVFLFVRRALALAKENGGRICLIVPDGFLAKGEAFLQLRKEILGQCQVKAVVQLPRIFKYNNSSMSILYAVKGKRWNRETEVMMASIPLKHTDVDEETGEEKRFDINLNAELDSLLEQFRQMEERNSKLRPVVPKQVKKGKRKAAAAPGKTKREIKERETKSYSKWITEIICERGMIARDPLIKEVLRRKGVRATGSKRRSVAVTMYRMIGEGKLERYKTKIRLKRRK